MFTIRDLLNIGDLQDITLITDDQGMDNVITHAITMDNPEMVHWMKRGEILLTTGYNFIEDDFMQKQLVMELANTGCSGLGLKIKRYFKKTPKVIIDEAKKVGLPVIEIPYYYTLSDMARIINEQIFSERMDTYKKQELFLDMIMETVSKGGGIKGILSVTESILDCPVLITDTLLNINEHSPSCTEYIKDITNGEKSTFEAIRKDSLRSKATNGCALKVEINTHAGEKNFEVYYINIANMPMEYLILIKNKNEIEHGHTAQLVKILAAYLSNYYLIKYENKFEAVKGTESFLFMLLNNSTTTLKEIEKQAVEYRIDIEKKYACAVLQPIYQINDNSRHVGNMKYILDNIKTILYGMGKRKHYILTTDDNVIIIFAVNDNNNIDEINRETLELHNSIDRDFLHRERMDYYISNGNICDDLSLLWKSYGEAISTIELMKNNEGVRIGHYTDYIAYHMLMNFNEVRKYYYNIIKPLSEHDKNTGDELIPTLKVYINSQCKSTKAADKLYIHRNTLDYRIKKIKDILGYDFEDCNKVLELQMALIAVELQHVSSDF